MPSITLYLYTGDFPDAYERHHAGRAPSYAMHPDMMRTLDALVELDFKVRLVSFVSPDGPRTVEVADGQIEFVELGATAWNTPDLLRADVQSHPTDLLIAQFPNMELMRASLASSARLLTLLADSFGTSLRRRVRSWRLLRMLDDPRFEWVGNHGFPATLHLGDLGVDRSKLVPWDIDHGPFPATAPKGPPAGDPPAIFFAGSVTEPKGVGDLIRSIGALRSRGRDVRLDVAGNGELEVMRSLAVDQGVADLVHVLGPIDNHDVSRRMREAELVAVPSRHEFPEGLPLTLFEAVGSRTPIVCSDHPMFELYFRDGETALTFAAGDASELARAIERGLRDPDLYQRLSTRAETTWHEMTRSAHYTRLITEWATTEHPSPWIAERTLDRLMPASG